MSIKKLSADKRNKLIMVAAATVVIAVGLWFTLIESQNATISKLATRNAEEKQKLDNARKLLATKAEIDRRLEKLSTKLTSIEQEMVKGDMYDWVIQTVKTFKGPYRERIDIPNFSREVLGEIQMFPKFPYRSALYNIRGTAYYHDLGRFLADFENRFPFIRVQNLELEPASNSSATATEDAEKLAFKFELVALVSPTQP